jgi:hypothetical protein
VSGSGQGNKGHCAKRFVMAVYAVSRKANGLLILYLGDEVTIPA